ncbi:cytidylate kinase-like family protein [Clostridium hydrogenum]|uniref:cytidylate kinase-like family protein n=1 Tax=Clostridium hydrogenum TaxID=2855764 RepID=UPI001F26826F|nr:cytidylate kinase-like family protein [Clostridium hydrogenum]
MNKSNIVITINRQFGSGGRYLGGKLAEKLSFLYLDREIVKEAAQDLGTYVENLEDSDEKQSSLWKSLVSSFAIGGLECVPDVQVISDKKAHKAESNFITKVANEKSAVIIGRGGSYILQNHPRHVSIFLNADIEFRKKRIQEELKLSEKETLQLISKTDKERLKYFKALTGEDMYNACGYNLSIDTGKLGLEKSIDIIMEYLKERFGYDIK